MNSDTVNKNRSYRLRLCFGAAVLMMVLGAGVTSVQAARGRRQPARGPYLQNLQAQQVTVCWEGPQPHTGEVHLFDADGKLIKQFATATKGNRHEVVVDGLGTGQRYSYEVVAPGGKSVGKGSFRSAPARGEPLSFVAWGDTRGNSKTTPSLAAQIMKTGVGMCIHSGDMVDDGRRLDQWDEQFFGPLAGLLRNVVLWPAIGNHDNGMMPNKKSAVFNHLFALPGKEAYYSFDYGDAHFIVFDATRPLAKQVKFAEQDLSKTDAKWKFAAWHFPPFSSGKDEGHVPTRTQLLPLLARHNVDMIILGHNHLFRLSKPIRHVYEPQHKRPYVQLVTGGGGAQPHSVDKSTRWFSQGSRVYHFVLIEVDGDILNARVIDGRGRVVSRFEIDKTKPMENAVPFELIELERYLRGVDNVNTNLEGWPTGLVLKPGETSGQFVYRINNPLQEPIKLRIQFDMSAGLTFDSATRELEIPRGEAVELEVPFHVTSQEKLYPVRGPSVALECSLGKGQVRSREPLIAMGRQIVARRIKGPISVDGKPTDSAWSEAIEHGQFIRWDASNLAYEAPENESTLRAVHDGDHLYLFLQRPPSRFEDRDRFSVYLASPDKALGVIANVSGEHHIEGTKGIEKDVVVAHSKESGGIAWEIKVPLINLRDAPDASHPPLVLNVMEGRGNQFFTLAPTFHQHPTRTNSAILVLE